MKKIFTLLVLSTLLFTSCNKWLDVQPEKQIGGDKLFTSQSGFYDALNGCYIGLKQQELYGENLTYNYLDAMAQLWLVTSNNHTAHWEVSQFDWEGDNSRAIFRTIYTNLFNVVAQANMIIDKIEEKGDVISPVEVKNMIEGEAYAIRAFCHMDILRLFGEVPNGTSTAVELPYQESVSAIDFPKYLSFDKYVEKIESDLEKAESLLLTGDPVMEHSFSSLNIFTAATLPDAFLGYRQNRLNYWAVKGLRARLYRYIGDDARSYALAKEIIDATNKDGSPVITLSGTEDINAGYFSLPTEALFSLNTFSIADYSPKILAYGGTQVSASHLYITSERLNELFTGQNPATNNRYNNQWHTTMSDVFGDIYPVLKKYYYDKNSAGTATIVLTKRQVVPILRLSEIYLIAMEGTTNLTEANELWREYMLSHNVHVGADEFAALDDIPAAMINEYRREFYGEGQMFYTYKRFGASEMRWGSSSIEPNSYIIPLPESEFNPDSK